VSERQVAPVKAIGILTTAFLASLSASSFFFIQPDNGANADSATCITQGVVQDTEEETIISLTVNLSKGCSTENGILYGVDENEIAYKLEEVPQSSKASEKYDREAVVMMDLTNDYTYYTFEIDKAFSVKIESR
jgi:hypothetical protein